MVDAEAILRKFVEMYRDTDGDAACGAGEFDGAAPCKCPSCRTYRAALFLFEETEDA